MKLREYKLKKFFKGVRYNNAEGKTEYKECNEGDLVYGLPTRDSNGKMVRTDLGYMFPSEYLTPTGNTVNTKTELPNGYQEIINKIKNNDLTKDVLKKSKASINGAVVGAVIGIVTAWLTKKPVLPYFFIGTVGGGIAGNLIGKKQTT